MIHLKRTLIVKTKTWKKEKEYIIALLEDYPNYQTYCEQRKYELQHPATEPDDNVGGGKAQFKQENRVDHMLILTDEDKRLNELRRIHYAFRVCLDEAPEDVHIICEELYFKKQRDRKYHSITDLCNAQVIFTSKTAAYDEFNIFLKSCAEELGLPI